jgi:hypothetical protein
MSLPAPNLDSRTFDDLVKEARERIPRFTQEWTNFNDADPGMTIVKLHAWLTETLLHEVNRLPELNYIKFLQLINITPKPAQAATTELQFNLKKLDTTSDPLTFFVPKNAQVEADDPDLTSPVIFETERTLVALNATIATIISRNDPGSAQARSLVTSFDPKKATTEIDDSFYPFGENPQIGSECLVGILLRPNRKSNSSDSQEVFPAGELDLAVSATQVYEDIPQDEVLTGPVGKQCLLPHELTEQQQVLRWQVYVGSEHAVDFIDNSAGNNSWQTLYPPTDDSAALSRSGHIPLTIPEDISQVSLTALPRSFWLEMGLKKPPKTGAELLTDLLDTELNFTVDNVKDIDWAAIAPDSIDSADIQSACGNISSLHTLLLPVANDIQVSQIPPKVFTDGDFGYSSPAVPEHAMAWLKVSVVDADYQAALLNGFYINRVPATAAVSRVEEILGVSDGRPAQTYTLAKTPVYFEPRSPEASQPDLELEVVEGGQTEPWQRVDDFGDTQIDSFSKVYRLDPVRGVITFGDGIKGRIPVADAQIKAKRYRYGGGASGNVAANTITKLKTSLPYIDSVTNPRSATGGSEAETLEQAKLRAPQQLRTRERAVTAEDFAFLAKHTPGVVIHTAYALAQTALHPSTTDFIPTEGAVTVVVLPANQDQPMPEPSEGQLDAVCAHLNSRRLITTELYVTGPRYLPVTQLEVDIRAAQNADLKSLVDAAYDALLNYFHPLKGGEKGLGWPFGEDVYLGEIYQLLQQIDGVRRVFGLTVSLEGVSDDKCRDYLPVDDGYLLHLSREVINLKVAYEHS